MARFCTASSCVLLLLCAALCSNTAARTILQHDKSTAATPITLPRQDLKTELKAVPAAADKKAFMKDSAAATAVKDQYPMTGGGYPMGGPMQQPVYPGPQPGYAMPQGGYPGGYPVPPYGYPYPGPYYPPQQPRQPPQPSCKDKCKSKGGTGSCPSSPGEECCCTASAASGCWVISSLGCMTCWSSAYRC